MESWFFVFLVLYFALVVGLCVVYRSRTQSRHESIENRGNLVKQQRLKQNARIASARTTDPETTRLLRLQTGCVMFKHRFNTAGRGLRNVSISTNVGKKAIVLQTIQGVLGRRSSRAVEIADILAVQLGPASQAFARNHEREVEFTPELCFSVITEERTLDFEAIDMRDLEDWFLYLQGLYADTQAWAGLPLYTRESLKRATTAIQNGARPPRAFDFARGEAEMVAWCEVVKAVPPAVVMRRRPSVPLAQGQRPMSSTEPALDTVVSPPHRGGDGNRERELEMTPMRGAGAGAGARHPAPASPAHTVEVDCSVIPPVGGARAASQHEYEYEQQQQSRSWQGGAYARDAELG